MKYRRFGKLDWQVSALGFGAMRLPTVGEDRSKIDEVEAIKMLRYAIDHGVNYIDTAYPYHGGNSEIVVGKALMDGYREKVRIATKMPTWLVNSKADMDKYFGEQLKRLQNECIDFYLLHGLNRERWIKMLDLDVLGWAEKAIADGKIGHLGFSFHDEYEVFREIVDGYDGWVLSQIQYNFENEDLQAGTRGLEYAASKGLAVVVMEPLLGGYLVNPPDEVQKIWDEAKKNPVDMALQWLWNKPQVSVVLSGMSTIEQVRQNVESASSSGIGKLTNEDLNLIARVRDKYRKIRPIPCTKCGYCMPCPSGVNIPRNFELYNQGVAYNKMDLSRAIYNGSMEEGQRASACVACKSCEGKCPQKIAISEWMPRIHEELALK
jgi:predicted aldo/keto reductase-like oxidoreductase